MSAEKAELKTERLLLRPFRLEDELAKIYAIADLRSVRSYRVMEKLGIRREGVLRSHGVKRCERCNEILLLEDGRILEKGDRVKLASDPGSRFHGLLQAGLEEVLA